jgi:hypothetical protein
MILGGLSQIQEHHPTWNAICVPSSPCGFQISVFWDTIRFERSVIQYFWVIKAVHGMQGDV